MNKNNSNAYISSNEPLAMGSQRANGGEFKMSRNESKNSNNLSKDQMRNQPNRIKRMGNENNYANLGVIDSPEVGHKKLNTKAGVQLQPIGQPPNLGAGRASMMSIKGMEEDQNGTESHPILRVHNYKKPQLEKINHQ